VKAYRVNASVDTICIYDNEDFISRYEKKIEGCSFSDEKKEQLKANLYDTMNRLFSDEVPLATTECTWWDGHVLYFDPSQINPDKLTTEQRASLLVMNSKLEYSRIKIVFDLSKLSWSDAIKMTYNASFSNIVDGIRLWSTIPHSIDKIYIKINDDSNFHTVRRIILPLVLSSKLLQRIYVCNDQLIKLDT